MNQINQYQKTVESTIENATSIEEIIPYLKHVDFQKIKHPLTDVLKEEISGNFNFMPTIYFNTNSIVDILSLDVVTYIFRYFEIRDIFGSLSRVNTTFYKICKSKDTYLSRKLFYENDLFCQWFFKSECRSKSKDDEEWHIEEYYDNERHDAVYYLQNEYESSILNKLCQSPFRKLGSILKGQDWMIWHLCDVFQLNTTLRGRVINSLDGWGTDFYTNCFENIHADYESLESSKIDEIYSSKIYSRDGNKYPTQNDIKVIASYGWRKVFYLPISPVLLIEYPEEKLWIKKFENMVSDFGLVSDEETS